MADLKVERTLISKSRDDYPILEIAKGFRIDRKSRNVSKNTLKFYGVEFGRFLQFCEPKNLQMIQEITPSILREYLLHLEATGRNPGGIHAGYRAIKSLFIWYENEIEPKDWHNPIRKVRAPKLSIKVIEPVPMETVKRLVASCDGTRETDTRDRAMILFLLDTGARAFEACGADLNDLDLINGDLIIRHGKGDKQRMVMIGKRTRQEVRRYLRSRNDNCPALWITGSGERLTYEGLNQILRRRAQYAEVKKPGLHDFRRAFALNCLRNGMDIFTLQKLMGHADLSVLRRYLAQNTEDLRQAHATASPVDFAL